MRLKNTLAALTMIGLSAPVTAQLSNEPMTFTVESSGGNCAGCQWIQAEGRITEHTPTDFQEFLAGGGCYFIQLNSGGGNLMAGMELGRLFRENECRASVGRSEPFEPGDRYMDSKPGECYSACAYALLGGAQRYVDDKDKYGIHQHYLSSAWSEPLEKTATAIDMSVSQFLTGVLLNYVMEMGVDPKLVSLATTVAPHEEMLILNRDQLADFGVVSDPPLPMKRWQLEPYGSMLVAAVEQPEHASAHHTRAMLGCYREERQLVLTLSTDLNPQWLPQLTRELNDRLERDDPFAPIKVSFDIEGRNLNYVSQYAFKGYDDRMDLLVWVPQEFEAMLASGGVLNWQVDTSRANSGMLFGSLSLNGLGELVPFIHRECTL